MAGLFRYMYAVEQSIPAAKRTIAITQKGNDMETQDRKSPHTLFWIAGIAVTVFSAVGIFIGFLASKRSGD